MERLFGWQAGRARPASVKSHFINFVQSCEFEVFFVLFFWLQGPEGFETLCEGLSDQEAVLFLHVCGAEGEICSEQTANKSENYNRGFCSCLIIEKTQSSD